MEGSLWRKGKLISLDPHAEVPDELARLQRDLIWHIDAAHLNDRGDGEASLHSIPAGAASVLLQPVDHPTHALAWHQGGAGDLDKDRFKCLRGGAWGLGFHGN